MMSKLSMAVQEIVASAIAKSRLTRTDYNYARRVGILMDRTARARWAHLKTLIRNGSVTIIEDGDVVTQDASSPAPDVSLNWADTVVIARDGFSLTQRHVLHQQADGLHFYGAVAPIGYHATCRRHDVTIEIGKYELHTITATTEFCPRCKAGDPDTPRPPDSLAAQLRMALATDGISYILREVALDDLLP
jgi:hypothetical protein